MQGTLTCPSVQELLPLHETQGTGQCWSGPSTTQHNSQPTVIEVSQ